MTVMVLYKNNIAQHKQSELYQNLGIQRRDHQTFQFQHQIVANHNFLFTVVLSIAVYVQFGS